MKHYRVYAYVTQPIDVYVRAHTADEALGNVRERLAVDHDPAHYTTVSQPTELEEWDRYMAGVQTNEEIVRGKPLTADERAYCNARGYGDGYDSDAFRGIQWSHIVDDSVPLCRTTGLWFSGQGFRQDTKVSCPFCRSILRQEMRYPHLNLHVQWRQGSRPRAVATVSRSDDGEHEVLKVNGVVMLMTKYMEDGERVNLWLLCKQINEAQAEERPPLPKIAPTRMQDEHYRRAVYASKRSLLAHADNYGLSDERKEGIKNEIAEVYERMTPAERADVDAYYDDPYDPDFPPKFRDED